MAVLLSSAKTPLANSTTKERIRIQTMQFLLYEHSVL